MSGWLLGNMIWTSLLLLVVLAIRTPFARLLGAGPAYALWLIPALRLIAPPLPAWQVEMPAQFVDQPVVIWMEGAAAAVAAPPVETGWPWATILTALWLAGFAVFAVWQWRSYRALLTRLSLSSRSIGTHCGLPLVESGAVEGPLALGLLDRRIVVPRDFADRYTPAERALALDHEATHHRRGDIWWNFAALLFLAVNWFNPVAWLAFRAFRADQELACDAAVTAGASIEARSDYAQAMVKSASPAGLIAVSPLNHADQLKRRLTMMTSHRTSRFRTLSGFGLLALLAGTALTAGTPGFAQDDGAEDDGRRVIVRTERQGDRRVVRDERVERSERTIIRRSRDGETVETEAEDFASRPEDRSCTDGDGFVAEEGSADNRVRIVVCSDAGASPAERAADLQRTRDRMAANDEIDTGIRQSIVASMDREIARLRDGR